MCGRPGGGTAAVRIAVGYGADCSQLQRKQQHAESRVGGSAAAQRCRSRGYASRARQNCSLGCRSSNVAGLQASLRTSALASSFGCQPAACRAAPSTQQPPLLFLNPCALVPLPGLCLQVAKLQAEAERLIGEARAAAQKQVSEAKAVVSAECAKELAEAKAVSYGPNELACCVASWLPGACIVRLSCLICACSCAAAGSQRLSARAWLACCTHAPAVLCAAWAQRSLPRRYHLWPPGSPLACVCPLCSRAPFCACCARCPEQKVDAELSRALATLESEKEAAMKTLDAQVRTGSHAVVVGQVAVGSPALPAARCCCAAEVLQKSCSSRGLPWRIRSQCRHGCRSLSLAALCADALPLCLTPPLVLTAPAGGEAVRRHPGPRAARGRARVSAHPACFPFWERQQRRRADSAAGEQHHGCKPARRHPPAAAAAAACGSCFAAWAARCRFTSARALATARGRLASGARSASGILPAGLPPFIHISLRRPTAPNQFTIVRGPSVASPARGL